MQISNTYLKNQPNRRKGVREMKDIIMDIIGAVSMGIAGGLTFKLAWRVWKTR